MENTPVVNLTYDQCIEQKEEALKRARQKMVITYAYDLWLLCLESFENACELCSINDSKACQEALDNAYVILDQAEKVAQKRRTDAEKAALESATDYSENNK